MLGFCVAYQKVLKVKLSLFTHIDDGVGLDVVHVRVAEAQLLASPLGGADDAGGDGVLQGERAANSNHKLPWSQISWTTQRQHRKLFLFPYGHAHAHRETCQTGTYCAYSAQREKHQQWRAKKFRKETNRERGRRVQCLQNRASIWDMGVRIHTSALCVWVTELLFIKVFPLALWI